MIEFAFTKSLQRDEHYQKLKFGCLESILLTLKDDVSNTFERSLGKMLVNTRVVQYKHGEVTLLKNIHAKIHQQSFLKVFEY